MEINNISCFKKYWLDFHRGISTVKINPELFGVLTGAFSTENSSTVGFLLKTLISDFTRTPQIFSTFL